MKFRTRRCLDRPTDKLLDGAPRSPKSPGSCAVPWDYRNALGLATGFAGGCRNAQPAPVQRAALSEDEPVVRPASTEALVALTSAPRAAEPPASPCGDGMALVEGNYCPDVRLNCKKYLDPKGRYEYFRCAEYGPSTCLSKQRKAM